MEGPQKIIENLFEKGVLISKDFLDKKLDTILSDEVVGKLEQEGDLLVLNADYVDLINVQKNLIDWYEMDFYRVLAEKERDDELYQAQLQSFRLAELHLKNKGLVQRQELTSGLSATTSLEEGSEYLTTELATTESNFSEEVSPEILASSPEFSSSFSSPSSVQIIISYKNEARKFEVKDFTQLFTSRYKFLESLLRQRQELQNTMSISRLLNKKEKENISLIALVEEIGETKNGNIVVTAEDVTGDLNAQ